MNKPKVIFISSTGGHLSEMLRLKELFKKYDYHIITENTKTNYQLREDYNGKVSYLLYGTKHHMLTYPFVCIVNIILSIYYYIKYKPKYIITTGAHTCYVMCVLGHLFGSKVIFIESFANISTKTLTGRLVYKIADVFIVQWESMLKLYPKAIYGGWIY